jgi:metal transporter CNNM
MHYIISILLVTLSALFSGLSLALLSLKTETLKRKAQLGNKDAQKVYPIRARGNLLLTTLLLGNVAVNASLSVFLSSIASGIVAGIVATILIFLFGEIIPQSVMSRHAMWFGARTAPFVRIVMILMYPIAFPIASALDWILGDELPTIYTKKELMELISEHEDSEFSTIDRVEERIVHGALQFSHKNVKYVMTPLKDIIMYKAQQKLSEALFEKINRHGYSRYPVYSGSRKNILGILYAKDLILEETGTEINQAEHAYECKRLLIAKPDEFLDNLLMRMLKRKQHMAIVRNTSDHAIGIITLEDIIEEIIQHEIEDEDD